MERARASGDHHPPDRTADLLVVTKGVHESPETLTIILVTDWTCDVRARRHRLYKDSVGNSPVNIMGALRALRVYGL